MSSDVQSETAARPKLWPDHLDRRRPQAELVEDLRDVLERSSHRRSVELFGHDDAVPRHQVRTFQRGREKSRLPFAFHRAVRPQHIDAALVGAAGRTARLREVVRHALVGLVDERAFAVDRAEHAHHGRLRRHEEAVAVLERQIGEVLRLRFFGQLEHHAADRPDLAQARDEALLVFRLLLERGRVFGRGHVLRPKRVEALHIALETIERFLERFLLLQARRFPRELRAEQIRVRREPAHAGNQLSQGLTGHDLVHAGAIELAFQSDVVSLPGNRNLYVFLREDRDDVARLQRDVVHWVPVDHRLPEIKRDERAAEVAAVEALDDRIVPVDLALRRLDLVDEAQGVGLCRLEAAFICILDAGDLHGGRSLVWIQESRRLGLRLQAANRVPHRGVGLAFASLVEVVHGEPCAGRALLPENARDVVIQAHGLVALQPVFARQQCLLVRDEVAHAHALAPGEAAGLGDVAPQRHGVVEARHKRIYGHQVAVAYRSRKPAHVERELLDLAHLVVFDALDRGLLPGGGGGQASRPADEIEEDRVLLELVYGGHVHAAGDRDQRPDGRDVDDIARQERHVLGLVTRGDQIIQIELGDDAVVALELNVPHRALGGRTAGREQRGHQGAQGAHRVGAGALRLSDDEDLDRAQLAERRGQLEVAEGPAEDRLDVRGQVVRLDPRDVDHAHLGHADRAVAVDDRVEIDVDLAPGADLDFVAGPDHVVGRDRDVFDRREGARHVAEEIGAEHRQIAADRLHHELLELVALPLLGLEVLLQLLELEFLDALLKIAAGKRGARPRRGPGLAGALRGSGPRAGFGSRARPIGDQVDRAADVLEGRDRRRGFLRGDRGGGRLSGFKLRENRHPEQRAHANSKGKSSDGSSHSTGLKENGLKQRIVCRNVLQGVEW